MKKPQSKRLKPKEDVIRKMRIATLIGVWEMTAAEKQQVHLTQYFGVNAQINLDLVAAVVEQYMDDRRAYIERNKIRGRIQRHKAAGLMAARIVRVRPVQIFDGTDHSPGPSYYPGRENDVLAIMNGLAICAEGASEKEIRSLLENPYFKDWFNEILYLLSMRHDCSEACCAIFGTLSLAYFPKNFDTPNE